MNTLKTNILNEMEKKSWSVHALEKQAGLKPSAIRNILYGRSKNPSLSVIQSIAAALNCSVTDLIDEELVKKESHNGKPMPKIDDFPWDQQLYQKCMQQLLSNLSENSVQLKRDKVISIIDDVYFYSCVNKLDAPDQYFLNWLIEKCKE